MNKKLIIGVFFILNLNSGNRYLEKMPIWSLKASKYINNLNFKNEDLDLKNLLKNFDPNVDLINKKKEIFEVYEGEEQKNDSGLGFIKNIKGESGSEVNEFFKGSIVLSFYSDEQK